MTSSLGNVGRPNDPRDANIFVDNQPKIAEGETVPRGIRITWIPIKDNGFPVFWGVTNERFGLREDPLTPDQRTVLDEILRDQSSTKK